LKLKLENHKPTDFSFKVTSCSLKWKDKALIYKVSH